MGNLEIIQLSPDQWESYKNLRLKALKESPEAFGQTHAKVLERGDEEWKMLLDQSGDGQRRWVFFAKIDGELVGMVSGTAMQSINGGVKIRELFVINELRGKGVATKLMESLEKELLEHTDQRILRLGVFSTQTEAVNLYKGLGFKVIEEKTEHFVDGPSHESLIMEKALKKSS